jgi:rhodanese-related sulfurtransferase
MPQLYLAPVKGDKEKTLVTPRCRPLIMGVVRSHAPRRAHHTGRAGPAAALSSRLPGPGKVDKQGRTAAAARRPSIDQVLQEVRSRFARLDAIDAARLLDEGRLVLVDTRPLSQRLADGDIPGALAIDRNVLEWRLDPASGSRLPIARYDLRIAVICAQGYSSSLAAASLRELGLRRATDVVGGFEAWRAAGLPVVPLQEEKESTTA